MAHLFSCVCLCDKHFKTSEVSTRKQTEVSTREQAERLETPTRSRHERQLLSHMRAVCFAFRV